ncbi:uncharacterized protein G2W53_045146 [Senna tora]|uniref:Uncharacterized protein n=1 Tax=Senna tora TaxID=362788 RepID=A0A834SCH9_9FABA|nr:uncharacterized protein G2W53_045146 [Senna tora]
MKLKSGMAVGEKWGRGLGLKEGGDGLGREGRGYLVLGGYGFGAKTEERGNRGNGLTIWVVLCGWRS